MPRAPSSRSTRRLPGTPLTLSTLGLLGALGACAAPATPAAAPAASAASANAPTQRWIVHTVADWADAGAFARRAAAVAGVPVLRADASTPRQFVLILGCDTEPSCQAAAKRLAADTALVRVIEPDRLVRLPRRPDLETAR